MMDRVIFAGFGGQGVMFIGRVLAYAGMGADLELCWIPSYGPEMRGGTANCSVILSDEEIHSPVIDFADGAIVLNKPAYDKFAPRIKEGGILVVNSSLAKLEDKRDDITIIEIPATDIASEMGNVGVTNMVCLGALLPSLKLVDLDMVKAAMKEITAKRPQLYETNLEAIAKGMAYIKS